MSNAKETANPKVSGKQCNLLKLLEFNSGNQQAGIRITLFQEW